MKRSTRLAEEKMRAANIPCWIETHEKMKWRLAMRITSHPETRNSKMESTLQHWIQSKQSSGKTEKEMGH